MAAKKKSSPGLYQGKLLLSEPAMVDGIFRRSVIFLPQHNAKDGAFGVILNHPTDKLVGDLFTDKEFHPLRNVPVYAGGPVNHDNLFFAALWWEQDKGLCLETQIAVEDAIKYHKKSGTLVRAFVGYSGWTPGQLEEEMKKQTWIVTAPNLELFSHTHDDSLWANTLRPISAFHRLLADFPYNPKLN